MASEPRDLGGATERWEFGEKHACGANAADHKWHPIAVEFERTYAGPGRCTIVCLDCGACTYIETWWPGYKLANAFDLGEGQGGEQS